MTITYRGGGDTSNTTTTGVVTMSVTAVLDDYLIAVMACDVASNTRTWPASFTERGLITSAIDGGLIAWADKIAGASEPGTYTISVSDSGNDLTIAVVAWSGVDTTTPRDVTPTASASSPASTASPWNCTAPGLATGTAGRALIWIGGVDNALVGAVTSAVPTASPAAWTERIDASNGAWVNLAICDCTDTAGTHTTSVTGVQTLSGNGGAMAFLIALRAATAGASFIASKPFMLRQAVNRASTY